MTLARNPCGSLWHRWDPHLHAPGTLLNDQFHGDWEGYLQRIENSTPAVRALGVTDYYSLECYREVRTRKDQGRLPSVEFLFPNIEMRLNLRTDKGKGLNVHLLFSPEDPEHETRIEGILARLTFAFGDEFCCTPSDLVRLGRAFDPTAADERRALEIGTNQFKVDWTQLKRLLQTESWLEHNCLLAVSGTVSDGTAGLQRDDSFSAIRRDIERHAHLVLGATPSLRAYWLGDKEGFDRETIESRYGALKPCIHGSDSHDTGAVVAPAENRFCWLKGDLCFETLRQAVVEPAERVWIDENPPEHSLSSSWMRKLTPRNTPWFSPESIPLNPGLVAVIGARGSGKTALVDIVAAGSQATTSFPESSFLRRASSPTNHLREASVEIEWADGEVIRGNLDIENDFGDPSSDAQACYLSQHFVERLCSARGLATELRDEIERVIFNATDPTARLEADSFRDLANLHLEPSRRRRLETRSQIDALSTQVEHERATAVALPALEKQADARTKELEKSRAQLAALLPKGMEVRVKRLDALEKACAALESKLERLNKQLLALDDLTREVQQIRTSTEPHRLADMRRRFSVLGLSPTEWDAFRLNFTGDVEATIDSRRSALRKESEAVERGDGKPILAETSLDQWPLNALREARDAVKKELVADAQRKRQYDALQRAIAQTESSIRKLQVEIANARDAAPRINELMKLRREAYCGVFDTISAEEDVLRRLYRPLEDQLSGAEGALGKLRFVVRRAVDVAAWVNAGEDLLDLRLDSAFRGQGSLKAVADQRLVASWQSGGAREVGDALHGFLAEYGKDLAKAARELADDPEAERHRLAVQRIARWLFSTDHVQIQYGIEYDGVAIEQLSPGTRGVVLLLLYLAIDQHDRRPLIVDQPEENLDPNSVYEELVPHFRKARRRRQVVIVTHNANLVVNTDADQVIVAKSIRTEAGGLPAISYRSGSLENAEIRRSVCEILEGGERAFLERERRYRLRWGDAIRRNSPDGDVGEEAEADAGAIAQA